MVGNMEVGKQTIMECLTTFFSSTTSWRSKLIGIWTYLMALSIWWDGTLWIMQGNSGHTKEC